MAAYSSLQEKEFSCESQFGYEGVKHQRFVGTGYFDQVQHVISGGLASTVALADSTEADQFRGGNSDRDGRTLDHMSSRIPASDLGSDDMLLPSGD